MKVWEDKKGNKINSKEFIERFKEGVANITPKQKLENDFISNSIVFAGYLIGMVALIVFWKKLIVGWFSLGLILIFAGMAYSTFIKLIMIKQQIRLFRDNKTNQINLNKILNNLNQEKEDNYGS